ncbi:uncharacterized protein BXZ73DRAFT_101632 [Epithele typhae]|uniref:uncharacterized protein n=1 Tax=Epithele typhae TaxID=378194 RepID=UPI0020073838|nr:uncharacterized protein BXZ73DRAFT_101632 [Epithele typhae]KAH9931727.1 hypothetical protein BXZ73DRAFT_101632 [Epithele typhae]
MSKVFVATVLLWDTPQARFLGFAQHQPQNQAHTLEPLFENTLVVARDGEPKFWDVECDINIWETDECLVDHTMSMMGRAWKTRCQTLSRSEIEDHAKLLLPTHSFSKITNARYLVAVITSRESRAKHVNEALFDDQALRAKRKNVYAEFKSSLLTSVVTHKIDGRSYTICNYRPELPPPIGIYHPVFARFVNNMRTNAGTAPTAAEIKEAYNFCSAAATWYNDEDDRLWSGCLERLRKLGLLEVRYVDVGDNRIKTDGFTCSARTPSGFTTITAIMEVNGEIGEGEDDPAVRAERAYVRIYDSDAAADIRAVSCCPALLLAHAGPNIQVLGAVSVDQIIIEPLTDYISLLPRRSPGSDAVTTVARLFRSLRQALAELHHHYAGVVAALPSMGSVICESPWFCAPHFTTFNHPVHGAITLSYEYRLAYSAQYFKAIFRATATVARDATTHDVVVKFARTYGAEGHTVLARKNLAPALWYCAWEESVGSYVVVMDFVRGVPPERPLSAAHKTCVSEAMGSLHDEDIVHGDLRWVNLIAVQGTDRVVVVDFDWCGKVGTARYPRDINMDPKMGWDKGVGRGELIQKAHDEHLVRQLTPSVG